MSNNLLSTTISNLLNGVSQQAPALRMPSQASEQINFISSPVKGLRRRPGSKWINRLMDLPAERPFVHTINRDKTERYQVIVADGDLRVFDLFTGQEMAVNFPEGKAYLESEFPQEEIRALTVEDYTFFVNKRWKPSMVPIARATENARATVTFELDGVDAEFKGTGFVATGGGWPPATISGTGAGGGSGQAAIAPTATVPASPTPGTIGAALYWYMTGSYPTRPALSNLLFDQVIAEAQEQFEYQADNYGYGGLLGQQGTPVNFTIEMGPMVDEAYGSYPSYARFWCNVRLDTGPNAGKLAKWGTNYIDLSTQATPMSWFKDYCRYGTLPASGLPAGMTSSSTPSGTYEDIPVFPPGGVPDEMPLESYTYEAVASGMSTDLLTWKQSLGAPYDDLTAGDIVLSYPTEVSQWDTEGADDVSDLESVPGDWTLRLFEIPSLGEYTSGQDIADGFTAAVSTGTQGVWQQTEYPIQDPLHGAVITQLSDLRKVQDRANKTGYFEVVVNGRQFKKTWQPNWIPVDYARWFKEAIAAAFPALDVSYLGATLTIEAGIGEELEVATECPNELRSIFDGNTRLGYAIGSISRGLNLLNGQVVQPLYIVIKQGVAKQTYFVSLDGNQVNYTTGNTNNPETWTNDEIARQLSTAINAMAGFTCENYGSFLVVQKDDGADFTWAVHDTWGDQAMYAMRGRVAAIEDLPEKFLEGIAIEIAGTDGLGGYYLEYTYEPTGDSESPHLGTKIRKYRATRTQSKKGVNSTGVDWTAVEAGNEGIWKETYGPNTPVRILPDTMPHALIREADGSFTFKSIVWEDRKVGDEKSVPPPSFIDQRIADVFFYRNRFGILPEESVVCSGAGEFFTFWPTTAKDVLDSDPIDVKVSHTKVSILRSAAVFNQQMLLFSDNTQFVMSAQQLLTPKTATVTAATEFPCKQNVRPVTMGPNVYFAADRGNYTSVREYFVMQNQVQNDAPEITRHVPSYIGEDAFKIAACHQEDMLAVCAGTSYDLPIYKFTWSQEKKVQESWSKFHFGHAQVLNADFVESLLYLTLAADDGIHLEVIDCQEDAMDSMEFPHYLDSWVKVTGEYNSETNQTVFTKPSGWGDGTSKVHLVTYGGVALTPAAGANPAETWTISGNHTDPDNPVYLGYQFFASYKFSPFFLRDNKGSALQNSKAMLKTIQVNHEAGSSYTINVTPKQRATFTRDTAAGSVSTRSAVQSDGETVEIQVTSDSWKPCTLHSATLELTYHVRSRRV